MAASVPALTHFTSKSPNPNRRHTILSISPYDVEDYLVTAAPSARRDLADEAIANLETLKSHVDQLAGIVATETSAMTEIIRSIKFLSPEKGQLMASVDLGEYDSDPGLVSMVLKREDTPGVAGKKVAWKFHNLMPCGAVRGAWVQDSKQALAVHDPPKHTSTSETNLERVRSATSVATSKTTDTFATATESRTGPNGNADDSDDDEESAKQQHFTEAEDFWGGWDDEGQDDKAQPAAPDGKQSNQANTEDDYWNSYDAQDPYDESQKRYAAELQRQHQMDLDTASQVGSVNFDNLERRVREEELGSIPGDYFGADAVRSIQARSADGRSRGARTQGPGSVVDQSIPEESPLEGNMQPTASRSQDPQARAGAPLSFAQIKALSRTGNTPSHASASHATRSAAALSVASPRSDSTDLGNDDDDGADDTFEPADHDGSEGTYSHDVTTVAGTVDDHYSSQEVSKGQQPDSNQSTFGDSSHHRTSRQGFKSTTADQDDEESASAMRDRQNLNLAADRQTDGGADPSRRAVDAAEEPEEVLQTPRNSSLPSDQSRERLGSRALPFAYQPPPMSVTGQSTFETPEDMTLADLEAFYRGREQQRMLETRERISRLHHNYSQDDGSGGEEDDDDEGEARSAIDEARSALGDVVPDYTGLPGFGPSEPAVQKKQKQTGRSEPDIREKQDQRDQPEAESEPQGQDRRASTDKHSSRGPRSDADPIEALAQADPTLAFNAEDEDKDASRQHAVPSNKAVSMDMLRKLAEENRLSGPGVKSGGKNSETTSTSGKSKSGGFKNFLQLAPSTVFTDAELEDEPDDEDEPPPPPSEAARPPSVVPEDAEGELEENETSQETQRPPVEEEAFARSPGFEFVEPQDDGPPSDNFSVEEQRSEGTMPLEEDDRGDQRDSQGTDQRLDDMPVDEPQHDQDADQQQQQDDDSQAVKTKGKDAEDDFDFNAFMFPLQAEEKRRKGAHLDSPDLSDTDPAAKEAMDMITGQRKKKGKNDMGDSSNIDYTASETFCE